MLNGVLGEHGARLDLERERAAIQVALCVEETRKSFSKALNDLSGVALRATKWRLLRGLVLGRVFRARLSRVKTRDTFAVKVRRHVVMQAQGLLSSCSPEWAPELREQLAVVLADVFNVAMEGGQIELAQACLQSGRQLDLLGLATFQTSTAPTLQKFERQLQLGAGSSVVSLALDTIRSGISLQKAGANLNIQAALDQNREALWSGVLQQLDSAIRAASGTAACPSENDIVQECKRVLQELTRGQGKRKEKPASGIDGLDMHRSRHQGVMSILKRNVAGMCEVLREEGRPLPELNGLFGLLEMYEVGGAERYVWTSEFCQEFGVKLPDWVLTPEEKAALEALAASKADPAELRAAVLTAKALPGFSKKAGLSTAYQTALKDLKALHHLPPEWQVEVLLTDKEKLMSRFELSDSKVMEAFQRLFNETYQNTWTRDRKDGAVPAKFTVKKIVAVHNADQWRSYLERRTEIAEKVTEVAERYKGRCLLWPGVAEDYNGPIMTQSAGQRLVDLGIGIPALEEGCNEFLFFHGTSPEGADAISRNDFDISYASKTSLFGSGLYFAESCSKSDEYCKADPKTKWFPMLVVRVSLGHVNYIATREPLKDPGKKEMEQSCLTGECHSILGDRKKVSGTYREFVIFDNYQAYVCFIVWYTRA
jgi:hypothetical protein